jgi:hypothetical protein
MPLNDPLPSTSRVRKETPPKLVELRNELKAAKGLVRKKQKQITRYREEHTAASRREKEEEECEHMLNQLNTRDFAPSPSNGGINLNAILADAVIMPPAAPSSSSQSGTFGAGTATTGSSGSSAVVGKDTRSIKSALGSSSFSQSMTGTGSSSSSSKRK